MNCSLIKPQQIWIKCIPWVRSSTDDLDSGYSGSWDTPRTTTPSGVHSAERGMAIKPPVAEICVKWVIPGPNKGDTGKQVLYDLIYVWNLKKWVHRSREQKGGRENREMLAKGHKISVIKWINSADLMYSMVIIVNNYVLYPWNLLQE